MIGFWLFSIIAALVVSALATALVLQTLGGEKWGRKPVRSSREGNNETIKPAPLAGFMLLPIAMLSTMVVFGIDSFWKAQSVKTALFSIGIDPFFAVCAFMTIYLLGLCKDLSRVRELSNIVAQGICAALLVLSDFKINTLRGLFSIGGLSLEVTLGLTVLVILAAINTVPLIVKRFSCGKGICSLVLLYLAVCLFLVEDYIFAVIATAALGSNLIGIGSNFNKTNPLQHLGATGELTIGALVAVMAIRLCQGQYPCQTNYEAQASATGVILGLVPLIFLICLSTYAFIGKEKTKEKG